MALALGDFETGGGLDETHSGAVFPSPEARKEGWMYLLLKPGPHYLAAQRLLPESSSCSVVAVRCSVRNWPCLRRDVTSSKHQTNFLIYPVGFFHHLGERCCPQ